MAVKFVRKLELRIIGVGIALCLLTAAILALAGPTRHWLASTTAQFDLLKVSALVTVVITVVFSTTLFLPEAVLRLLFKSSRTSLNATRALFCTLCISGFFFVMSFVIMLIETLS